MCFYGGVTPNLWQTETVLARFFARKSTKCNKYVYKNKAANGEQCSALAPRTTYWFRPMRRLVVGISFWRKWPKDNARAGGQHLLARDPAQEFMCVEGNRKTFFMHTSNLWPNRADLSKYGLGQIAFSHSNPIHSFHFGLRDLLHSPPSIPASNIYSRSPSAGNATPVNCKFLIQGCGSAMSPHRWVLLCAHTRALGYPELSARRWRPDSTASKLISKLTSTFPEFLVMALNYHKINDKWENKEGYMDRTKTYRNLLVLLLLFHHMYLPK